MLDFLEPYIVESFVGILLFVGFLLIFWEWFTKDRKLDPYIENNIALNDIVVGSDGEKYRCVSIKNDINSDGLKATPKFKPIIPKHIRIYPRELIKKVISESGMDDVYKLAREMRVYLGIVILDNVGDRVGLIFNGESWREVPDKPSTPTNPTLCNDKIMDEVILKLTCITGDIDITPMGNIKIRCPKVLNGATIPSSYYYDAVYEIAESFRMDYTYVCDKIYCYFTIEKPNSNKTPVKSMNRDSSYNTMSRSVPTRFNIEAPLKKHVGNINIEVATSKDNKLSIDRQINFFKPNGIKVLKSKM